MEDNRAGYGFFKRHCDESCGISDNRASVSKNLYTFPQLAPQASGSLLPQQADARFPKQCIFGFDPFPNKFHL
jgi:hypothetical protein